VFERHSVLAAVLKSAGRDGADGVRRLRIGETRGWSLVQVAAFASTSAEFGDAMHSTLKVELPTRIGDVVHVDGRRLLQTGAEQYWIVTRSDDDILPSLQRAVPAQIGAITPLSHSRTCIFIEGAAARELLAKGVPLDFHPDVFRIDQFALTGLHHSPVLIHRRGEDLYELYALRTFGLSVWEWLTDAALPFGYEVVC
jgi:heterotetrameric sarcosine oxidase gamma subunit